MINLLFSYNLIIHFNVKRDYNQTIKQTAKVGISFHGTVIRPEPDGIKLECSRQTVLKVSS